MGGGGEGQWGGEKGSVLRMEGAGQTSPGVPLSHRPPNPAPDREVLNPLG